MSELSNQSGNGSEGEGYLRANNALQLDLFTALVQVLVWPLFSIELFMLCVFIKRDSLHTEARYVLFAQTLVADTCVLLLTDFVVISMHVRLFLPIWGCMPVVILMDFFTNVSPTIIVAMCLERYVAICMPLRHVTIFSPNRTLLFIVLIWLLCLIIPIVDLFIALVFFDVEDYQEPAFCYYEIMFVDDWHMELRSMFYNADCLFILSILLFCYVSIIMAAKRASADDKQSASKGKRTVLLHILQLFLCNLEVMCPYIEARVLEISVQVYLIIRFFNYLLFTILTKVASTLIYGLRDEKFRAAMKFYITVTRKVHQNPNK